jgi:histidine triad (HIT) family protein
MPTIFTKIINGEIPSHKILENEKYLAFLDVRPIAVGHALVIPKKEVNYFFDLDDQTMAELMAFAKQAARMIQKHVPCIKVGVMIAGLEVPHVHVHLVPIQKVTDLYFGNAKDGDHKALAELASKIRGS